MTERKDEEDLEEFGDTEPYLGSRDRVLQQDKAWSLSSGWILDGEPDNADDEPALGSLDQHDHQDQWAAGARRDLGLGVLSFDVCAMNLGRQLIAIKQDSDDCSPGPGFWKLDHSAGLNSGSGGAGFAQLT